MFCAKPWMAMVSKNKTTNPQYFRRMKFDGLAARQLWFTLHIKSTDQIVKKKEIDYACRTINGNWCRRHFLS